MSHQKLFRFSPDSYLNNLEFYKDDKEQRLFTAVESCWFTWCTLSPQGSGLVPKNASGRWVAASWWLFCFIAVASYTGIDQSERRTEQYYNS